VGGQPARLPFSVGVKTFDPVVWEAAMRDLRRFAVLDAVLLVAIVAGAAGVRWWYVDRCCQQGQTDGAFAVQDDRHAERDALVQSLKDGHGFVSKAPLAAAEEKTAHTSFAYPWLLSTLSRTADDLATPYRQVRWIQVGLGALTAGLYFLFARRAFHSLLVAALAGGLCAVHPFWVFNTAEINDGVLASFLTGLCLFLGARAGQGGGAGTSLLYGLGLAALALVRAALLPFAFVALLWFLLRCRVLVRGWLYALLAVLGFVNGLIPWTTRNFQLFGEVVPLVDSTFLDLWEGNNPLATGGPQSETVREKALAAQGTDAGKLGQMAQPERYRELAREAWNEVRSRPTETFQRRLRAGLNFLFGEAWFTDGHLARTDPGSTATVPDWLGQSSAAALAASLLAMLTLGVLGWRWSYGWRWEAMPSSLAAVWIALPYLLGHAERFSGPRLPLDGLLLCYVALVIACLLPPACRHLLGRPGDEYGRSP
jgi:hypothetical protein